MTAAAQLEVRALTVRSGERALLHEVSCDVFAGEVVAVVGPNGAGKTTLLEAIAGLRPIAAGTIACGGRRVRTIRERARVMGYVPDQVVLPEELTLGAALGLSSVHPLVARWDLRTLIRARANRVSRGEAARAQLAAALALGRPLLLLDEPFGAFDPRQLRTLLPDFREALGDGAALVTVHQMRTAELSADRILLLSQGRVIAMGTLPELRERAAEADLDAIFLALLDREESHASA